MEQPWHWQNESVGRKIVRDVQYIDLSFLDRELRMESGELGNVSVRLKKSEPRIVTTEL